MKKPWLTRKPNRHRKGLGMETYLVPMWVVECGVQRDGCISMVKAADAQATVEALQKKYDDLLGKYRQLIDAWAHEAWAGADGL